MVQASSSGFSANTGFRPGPLMLMRDSAIGAGEFGVIAKREITRIVKAQRGDQLSALKVGVDELVKRGLIEEGEAQELNAIYELIFPSGENAKPATEAARQKIEEIFHRLSIDSRSTPVAIAVASLANRIYDSAADGGSQPTAAARRISPEQGMAIGIGVGVAVGAGFGGVGGAILGGLVGFVLGTTLGVCDTAN